VGTSVDEAVRPAEVPAAYVERLAVAKADAGWAKADAGRTRSLDEADVPVLAADTAVVLDGKVLGKPADRRDAEGMLRQLSGRTHEVLTAIALLTVNGLESRICRSEVTFRSLAEEEIRDYWETGEPADKAGAYAIQGRAAVFIADLRGSYSGVMGLPLFETAELLSKAGVWHWPRPAQLSTGRLR
jgi:septum formation protein